MQNALFVVVDELAGGNDERGRPEQRVTPSSSMLLALLDVDLGIRGQVEFDRPELVADLIADDLHAVALQELCEPAALLAVGLGGLLPVDPVGAGHRTESAVDVPVDEECLSL